MTGDRADTTDLGKAIAGILPALERFYRFEGEDLAARRRNEWRAALDRSLPERGEGLDPVTKLLRDIVIPNGLRNGAPGFAGWITTSPTTSAVTPPLAADGAGPERPVV